MQVICLGPTPTLLTAGGQNKCEEDFYARTGFRELCFILLHLYHSMALVSITLPSFGQTEWMLSPTFVSSLSMDRGPFTKLMQPEACCQKVPPSVTIWKKHQAFMPGHKSFSISEPSLMKLLHFEGLGFASVSDKNPKFLMRTVISWSRGQGVGQWGMGEANLQEQFWSL